MTPRPPRRPPSGSRPLVADTASDDDALVSALRSGPPRLLHTLPPSALAAPGALDALLLRGVALVAYSVGECAIVARGTDLGVLRRLGCGGREGVCGAVSFRECDGAIAVAFGGTIVVFQGWDEGASLRGEVYGDEYVVAEGTVGFGGAVVALSWCAAGDTLVAVGEGVVVWNVVEGEVSSALGKGKEKGALEVVKEWIPEGLPDGGRLDMAVLSPDGAFLAGAAIGARVGWVWGIYGGDSGCAELTFGWEGIASMQWKPRGGGNAALMTVDCDGSMRLWTKSVPGEGKSWMEEIARSPHVEGTKRAGAAFVQWGGGGGVADDESDAAATAAAHAFAADGSAPRPSRALHWIVRVAGGDCRAWRVRGLDDRPQAEFARLEPGSGNAVVIGSEHRMYGADSSGDEDDDTASSVDVGGSGSGNGSVIGNGVSRKRKRRRSNSLEGSVIAATRALAPVPLTTSSSRRIGLVKSYATSNGERRLRSAEPPGPPTLASVFVLLVRDGTVQVARYDMSPTSDAPAACRACVGTGHMSPVAQMTGVPSSFTMKEGVTAGVYESISSQASSWLLSQGVHGDALLWQADAVSPTREPIVLSAQLPGPHTAVSFAPPALVSPSGVGRTVAMFGVDVVAGSLHLYKFSTCEGEKSRGAVQSVALAHRVASCSMGNNTGGLLQQLLPIPLARRRRGIQACLLLGFAGNGRSCCWHVSRASSSIKPRFEPVIMRFDGRRFGTVTAADSATEFGSSKRLVAAGSSDGCVRLYEVVHEVDVDEEEELSGHDSLDQNSFLGDSDCGESDGGENLGNGGVVRFREIAFLGEKDGSEASVIHIALMGGGERVALVRDDGSAVLWERASTGACIWHVALSVAASGGMPEPSENSSIERPGGISFGRDATGELLLYISRAGLETEVYRKPLGTLWERDAFVRESEKTSCPGPVVHIGLGVIAVGVGRSILAYETSRTNAGPVSGGPRDGAGYSPSRNLLAHLFSGGQAWQTIAALDVLSKFLEKSSDHALSSSTYAAGRGLAPPPPSLNAMVSRSDSISLSQVVVASEISNKPADVTDVSAPVSRNLFEELMAKSEAKLAADKLEVGDESRVSFDNGEDSRNLHRFAKLSKRLRLVSLAGLSRVEQTTLAALAQAACRVENILRSLDPPGSRFALIAATYLEASPTLSVPPAAIAVALHSTAGDALSNHFLKGDSPTLSRRSVGSPLRGNGPPSPSLWATARRLGAGWWLSTASGAKALVERIARTEYSTTRNADSAALWYIALGRVKPLGALYRAQQDLRMAGFLSRNFEDEDNRVAAGKNAYVLVSKHRHLMAVAFFILAGDVSGALALVRSRLKDDQLAILLARVLDNGSHVDAILDSIGASTETLNDPHIHSMALWLRGHHMDALQALRDAYLIPSDSVTVINADPSSEVEASLGAFIVPAALVLGHVDALVQRPPVRGLIGALRALADCRERAMHSLTAGGCPVAGLRVGLSLLSEGSEPADPSVSLSQVRRFCISTRVASAAAVALQERIVASSKAVRSGAVKMDLLTLAGQDLSDLCLEPLGSSRSVRVACAAAAELVRFDEIDSALSLSLAALSVSNKVGIGSTSLSKLATSQVEDVCYLACARSVSRCLCALSPLHRPNSSVAELKEFSYKMKSSVLILLRCGTTSLSLAGAVDSMKRAILALKISTAYMVGNWADLLGALRSCEEPPATLRVPAGHGSDAENGFDVEDDELLSRRSNSSSVAIESISLEGLRHMASNPAILGMSPGLGHRRRRRRAPSLALVDQDGTGASTAAVIDDAKDDKTARGSTSNDPIEFIRAHPTLNSALGCAAISYLSAHQAGRVSLLVKGCTDMIEASNYDVPSEMKFARLLDVSEALEQVASDSLAGWIPLVRFGSHGRHAQSGVSSTDESTGAFVELWCALGCLPEYAPTLSEAATVAAAEVASAAARRASAMAEKSSSRASRRRRRSHLIGSGGSSGGLSANCKSSEIFDTTSADSLFGAYPVRFSAAAKGPWSGRGRHARLYGEDTSLFRALCISASDPPAVIVATPHGIQEVVPSSYTAMPAGFRSHYFAKRKPRKSNQSTGGEVKEREGLSSEEKAALEFEMAELEAVREEADATSNDLMHVDTSFGEGSYTALDLSASAEVDVEGSVSSKRSSFSASGRDGVWRRQVQATALAAHPFKRRFASGGSDGVVRFWDFGNPISVGSLRTSHVGRVVGLKFSAYGNALVSVYASGHVALWQDPESYVRKSGGRHSTGRGVTVVQAFQNRNASDVVFLDERFTIAAVGDPSSPPAVGHGLRIFDTREANAPFHASWSARVHRGGEARCLTLLEDRVRVVTGGIDGTLSVVDLRMSRNAALGGGSQARVAELPAHDDEVTCLSLEYPRGRALISGCRNGDIKVWDARTLLLLDHIPAAHPPTRHYWSGNGIGGLVGSYGVTAAALTDRSLISCGGDGVLKVWGPGYSTSDLEVL